MKSRVITVSVKPRSSKPRVIELDSGEVDAHLTSSPVDGKANRELIKLIAKHFNVNISSVEIEKGFKSRKKIVRVYL